VIGVAIIPSKQDELRENNAGSLFPDHCFLPTDRSRRVIGVELDPGKMQAAHARHPAQGYLSAYAQEDRRPMTRSTGPA